jgi:hypothetical protein
MKFANLIGYSDIVPYEVIKIISDKTIVIREMKAEKDPSFKPEFAIGGFVAHCTNQEDQTWIISSNENSPTLRARLQKNGKWKSLHGTHRIAEEPKYFYDYNF